MSFDLAPALTLGIEAKPGKENAEGKTSGAAAFSYTSIEQNAIDRVLFRADTNIDLATSNKVGIRLVRRKLSPGCMAELEAFMTEELFSQSEAEQMVGCDTVAQEGCKSGVSPGTTGRVVGAQRHATAGWVLTVEWRAKDAGDMFYGILGELSINLFRSSQTIREQFSKPEFEKHVRCISLDHS